MLINIPNLKLLVVTAVGLTITVRSDFLGMGDHKFRLLKVG
jgi:hypothetical protein